MWKRVQPSPHTNWVLVLRDVRTRVRGVLQSLFLAPTTTKRRKHSNPPKLTTHPIQSYLSTQERGKERNPKPREEVFICMFCGHADHLDEFCFHRKRIEKRYSDSARNSYCDEFIDFLARISSHASTLFIDRPNHRSYGFDS
jgi:hypothetical protein